jgi:hypothetical protein
MKSITETGSEGALLQEGIIRHNDIERLKAKPENAVLSEYIGQLERDVVMLRGIIDRLPRARNQWNPQG